MLGKNFGAETSWGNSISEGRKRAELHRSTIKMQAYIGDEDMKRIEPA
jgi:hypothetical protein